LKSLDHVGLATNPALKQRRANAAKASIPGWVVSLVVMAVLVAAGLGAMSYLLPNSSASAEPNAEPAAASETAAAASHSLSSYIEVTGFRFLVDFNGKSEIHYLVVNHSSAAVSGVTVFVTLHSVNAKPGQPPVSRFSFRAADLGPFEAKEMSSPIEKLPRSVTLPEWQELRADVEVGQ
jgi:hypothetical protein